MKSFKNKVVVITGAGSGIGRATAHEFARAGARVHVVDINGDRVRAVCGEIGGFGGIAHGHEADCSSADSMLRLAENIYNEEGRVDVLQNGAGVLVSARVEELSLEDWRKAVDVNLWGVINSLHAFLPRMLSQGGGGHMVNIASLAGLVGFPFTVPYTTTKFAVVGMTEAMAVELHGRGVTFTAVCPGAVATKLMHDGVMDLPGPWVGRIRTAVDLYATRPEVVAKRIMQAVREKTELLVPTPGVLPLWWAKRFFDGTFRSATGRLAGVLLGGGSTASDPVQKGD